MLGEDTSTAKRQQQGARMKPFTRSLFFRLLVPLFADERGVQVLGQGNAAGGVSVCLGQWGNWLSPFGKQLMRLDKS